MPKAFIDPTNAVIGLMRTQDPTLIQRNYSVELNPTGEFITKLIEKPKKPLNDILGVGSYIFDERIFEAISVTKPSFKNEIEITDAINNLAHLDNAVVRPFFLNGRYLNITYPEDLTLAEQLLNSGST